MEIDEMLYLPDNPKVIKELTALYVATRTIYVALKAYTNGAFHEQNMREDFRSSTIMINRARNQTAPFNEKDFQCVLERVKRISTNFPQNIQKARQRSYYLSVIIYALMGEGKASYQPPNRQSRRDPYDEAWAYLSRIISP